MGSQTEYAKWVLNRINSKNANHQRGFFLPEATKEKNTSSKGLPNIPRAPFPQHRLRESEISIQTVEGQQLWTKN